MDDRKKHLIQLADQKRIVNDSYLLGLICDLFGNVEDYYHKSPCQYPDSSIIYVDDEFFFWDDDDQRFNDWLELNQSSIFIFKIQKYHDIAKSRGIKSILSPWWQVVDDMISMHHLSSQLDIVHPFDSDLAFCSFNRRRTDERSCLIQHLIHKQLIHKGHVTAMKQGSHFEGIRSSDLDHYVRTRSAGPERHCHTLHGIRISSNTLNCLHVNRHHGQAINIVVETEMIPFHPSEKSFLAFLTKKIPIILAEPGSINRLRQEGFDVFDDLIDHSYDQIIDADLSTAQDNQLRIKLAVDSNFDLLNRPLAFNADLAQRLDRNWNYCVHDWVWTKLHEIIAEIQAQLDTA
jgi:hypothetical protein